MPRVAKTTLQQQQGSIAPILDIQPNGVYRASQIQSALGLGGKAIHAEWKKGRIRILRRCNRNFILGKDIIAWLDGGEMLSPAKRHQANGHTNGAAG